MLAVQSSCRFITRVRFSPPGLLGRRVQCRASSVQAHAAGGGVRPTDEQSAEVAKLTEGILEAEKKLAALFEPGKPMPRAGVVASMRQEVSVKKARLAAIMSGSAPADMANEAPATDDELAERARQAFLEVERLTGQRSGSADLRDDGTAIALLEAENERLRAEATALLQRQQQLEELVEKHIQGDRGG
ncbi:hypothetical protein PLESTB_001246100 [Pleodorina starrii]|uniref:Uncharacterized protein n=1 Tax=Pleodorina starrii TaxID=330485 RepID=A0A9W6F5U2_9CHLO|nr:hypothetical protein PLESTM_000213800 [Pleodorina starrii]GLC57613.1 hypothetical protein PLESTB_001246100 [Pleodorina starrii]GLC63282.1 hypothetical protein PLESTF_000019800 [Pleodorina starrii]